MNNSSTHSTSIPIWLRRTFKIVATVLCIVLMVWIIVQLSGAIGKETREQSIRSESREYWQSGAFLQGDFTITEGSLGGTGVLTFYTDETYRHDNSTIASVGLWDWTHRDSLLILYPGLVPKVSRWGKEPVEKSKAEYESRIMLRVRAYDTGSVTLEDVHKYGTITLTRLP